MLPVAQNVTPLGIASLAISSVLAPATGWIIRNAARLHKKTTLLSGKVVDLSRDLTEVKRCTTEAERRLIKLEDALSEIRQAGKRTEAALALIITKLDALPRIDAQISGHAGQIAKIVPREEMERALSQHEQRLRLIEQDIRKG